MCSQGFNARRACLVLILALLAVKAIAASSQHPKGVNVQLRAKWKGTSLLLEAGELLASEAPRLYWDWLDQWVQERRHAESIEEQCLAHILQSTTANLGNQSAAFLQLSLALRLASPKLVLYQQLAGESLAGKDVTVNEEANDSSRQRRDEIRWSVNSAPVASNDRCSWGDIEGQLAFTPDKVQGLLRGSFGEEQDKLYEFDHLHPESPKEGPIAILYGSPGLPGFRELYEKLIEAVKRHEIKLVFRPVIPENCIPKGCTSLGTANPVLLGGYGVELALKNMEYKAIDDSEVKKGTGEEVLAPKEDLSQDVKGFLFQKLIERKPDKATELLTFREHLLSSGVVDEKINVWDLKDIGLQAAQRIALASDPLRLMQDISQNFPNVASSLSRMQLNTSITDEIATNQKMVQAGRNLVAINGAVVSDLENLDLFSLLDVVKQEVLLGERLATLKVPPGTIRRLLRVPDPQIDSSRIRVDIRSDEFIHYLNDLEKDARYARWRTSLQELLMPVFPGQLRQIRKNVFNVVYVLDPASPYALKVFESIFRFSENMVPLRFGLILVSPRLLANPGSPSPDDTSSLVAQAFLFLKEKFDAVTAYQFLATLADIVDLPPGGELEESQGGVVKYDDLQRAVSAILKAKWSVLKAETVLSQLRDDTSYSEQVSKSTAFVVKKGLSKAVPCMLMNGRLSTDSSIQESLLEQMQIETQWAQSNVYFGKLKDKMDVLDFALTTEGFPRYNPLILENTEGQHISLAESVQVKVVSELKYLHQPGSEDELKPVTHWVVVDSETEEGYSLLREGVAWLMNEKCNNSRVGVLSFGKSSLLGRVVLAATQATSRRAKIVPFLLSVLNSNLRKIDSNLLATVLELAKGSGIRVDDLESRLTDPEKVKAAERSLREQAEFCQEVLRLEPGEGAIVTNGRLLRLQNQAFTAEDFELLEKVEWENRAKPVVPIIETAEWEGLDPDDLSSEFLSTVIMAVASSVAARTRGEMSTANFSLLKDKFSAIVLPGSPDTSVEVEAIIDPLSTVAQRLSSMLLTLHSWLNLRLKIVLNPKTNLADLPIKSFYRYAAPVRGTMEALEVPKPVAAFANLPPQRTLTLNMDVPEPWLVEPVEAVHDLDNLVLEKLGDSRTLQAVFELEAVMLTGHCHEDKTRDPPRGMQLLLGSKGVPHMEDTIVMANLGYFQMKAAPGVWNVTLAAGRSRELYTIKAEKGSSTAEPLSRAVAISDFKGEVLRMEVSKRPGKEKEQILLDDKDREPSSDEASKGEPSLVGKLKGVASKWLGGGTRTSSNPPAVTSEAPMETINIFSVASGHLYERFLKIMILSVLKHTQRPVKFWFIKNYLSPRFKHFIPHMAKEHGFEYELVTYKWPSWLNKQSEKQRIIWAYKILFLDVLFPLNLKKVIFVDADQIVRTDMGDLYDMDLHGAPLAYTPFCDNNREMDGFRFWKQGFWKDHLRGKPYHISALYVVDLEKLRLMAAGDHYRVFYENLSKDPNSLANLDQDLPNYAQHVVPIFSLPQEWLWCESWCGNATKAQAKTIDLCNNPMTKEPKLEGARRIVSEWTAYDEQARRLTERIEQSLVVSAPEDLLTTPEQVDAPIRVAEGVDQSLQVGREGHDEF